MKMTRRGLCCDDCFEFLAKQDVTAVSLWMELCDIQNTCHIFGLRLEDNPYFQLLEILGFITTTDIEQDMIVVKVHGKEDDKQKTIFCRGECGQ